MTMRHLYPKTHSFLSSSSSSSTRRPVLLLFFLQRQPNSHSRGSHSLSAPLHRRNHRAEEEEDRRRQVKVSVWWDLERCGVPHGTNFFRVGPAITSAVRATDIRGPVEITAFGDILLLSRLTQDCLSSTGINLSHVPRSGKKSTDQSLILNLMNWVSQNPPPAHIFLISGDKEFAGTLHRLRMNNYNILLATPESAHPVLCSASSIMWNWYDLLCGENLFGKCFNQPPDGPYSSWYGHYKMPLLDPFSSDIEKRACLQLEESSSDNDPHLVPKSVRQQIHRIVESNPEGISITDLRVELGSAVNLDKEYYGYKRFVPFLLSLDNIVKLRQVNPGHFIVHARDHVDEAVNAPSELSRDMKFVKDDDKKISLVKYLGRVSSSPPSDVNGKEMSRNAQKNSPDNGNAIEMANAPAGHLLPGNEKNFETLGVEKVDEKIVEMVKAPESDNLLPHGVERIVETDNVPESNSHLSIVVRQESPSEVGLFRRFWGKWFGSKSSCSDDGSCGDEEKLEGKDSEKDSKSTIGFPDGVASSISDPRMENTKPGFLDRVQNWFKSSLESNKLSDCSYDEENLIIRDSGDELFSKDSFWSTMQSFMDTSQGSLIVSESRSREHMAHELQRKGPECLQSLGEKDLLHLITLLISEKKWVEECPSEVFPFKPTRVGKSSASEIHRHETSNSISSLFTTPSPHSVRKALPNHEGGEAENGSCRSRDEVLADCQNLLNEILKENKNGYTMALFRKHFLERYGYELDYKKLGHRKLSALLSTMSGVTIKSGDIFSSSASSENTTASDSSFSDASTNSDGLDSFSEELGPVASDKLIKTRPISKNDGSVLVELDSWHKRPVGDLGNNNNESEKSAMMLAAVLSDAAKKNPENSDWRVQARNQKRHPKNRSFVSDNANKDLADALLGAAMRNESSKKKKDKASRR